MPGNRCLPGLPTTNTGTASQADRACGGQQRAGPPLVAVLLLHGVHALGLRPEVPGGDQAGAARHPEGDRHLCPGAGADCRVAGRQGLYYTKNYSYALQAMQEPPYAKWREYEPEDTVRFYALRLQEAGMIKSYPPENHRPGHRLALPQRADTLALSLMNS
jgi:hypothetical protein